MDTCHRQKLEGDSSRTRARTLVARSVRSPEFRQWERSASVTKCPEKKRSCKERRRGAAVQLEERPKYKTPQDPQKRVSEAKAEKQQAPPWPDLQK